MEYAISVATVLIFFVVFLINRPKIREEYFKILDEDAFKNDADEFVRNMPLPTQSNSLRDKVYISSIKRGLRLLKKKKYSPLFLGFELDELQIKAFTDANFQSLQSQPSINSEPRNVALARFCLAHSDYLFCDDRVKTILELQNTVRTLSISEIMSMRDAFYYALIEKLAILSEEIRILTKLYNLAKKYVDNKASKRIIAKYPEILKSRLFLSMCAVIAGYNEQTYVHAKQSLLYRLAADYSKVANAWSSISVYDFSRFYTPLEIYDKFDAFSNATEVCKQNFFKLVKELSDKENIDEFMLAIRVEKYINSASSGHIKIKRVNIFDRQFNVVFQKNDISMLAEALSSKLLMNLCFNKGTLPFAPKNSKSTIKNPKINNTFEPIYKFQTVNFGINCAQGLVRLSPHLPRNIKEADVVFEANGMCNRLHIMRSEEKELWLGNTQLKGIEEVKLSDRPLDITLKIPYEK